LRKGDCHLDAFGIPVSCHAGLAHGTEDRILPFESTAKRLPALVENLKLIPVEGGPHNIGWTHPEKVNPALLEFLSDGGGPRAGLDRDLTAAAGAKS
jgi:hypothetical protein